jgi:hypothetical protein
MANRNLSSYQFQHVPEGGLNEIHVYVKGKKREGVVGQLSWDHTGMITSVAVHPDHQRLGMATEMHKRAKKINPGIHHAPESKRTPEGLAWSGAVGG